MGWIFHSNSRSSTRDLLSLFPISLAQRNQQTVAPRPRSGTIALEYTIGPKPDIEPIWFRKYGQVLRSDQGVELTLPPFASSR